MTPTPREKQRHADAGTPVDELRELMGYDSMTVTQTYYRVTAKRTRAAVDRLAALQFDGRGNRIWRQARALLEHEHQRDRKSTRLNSSHPSISYAVFCLKKK